MIDSNSLLLVGILENVIDILDVGKMFEFWGIENDYMLDIVILRDILWVVSLFVVLEKVVDDVMELELKMRCVVGGKGLEDVEVILEVLLR